MKIDDATSNISRRLYARVCVEIDLCKPLRAKFELRRKVRRIEYEGIHLVCFGCGMYGHRKDTCPLENKETTAMPEENQANSSDKNQEDRCDNQAAECAQLFNPEIVEEFGPWMLAKRRTLNHKVKPASVYNKEGKHKNGMVVKPYQSNASNPEELKQGHGRR